VETNIEGKLILCDFLILIFTKFMDSIPLNDKMILNHELEGVWKEMFVAYFKVLRSHYLYGLREATLCVKYLTDLRAEF